MKISNTRKMITSSDDDKTVEVERLPPQEEERGEKWILDNLRWPKPERKTEVVEGEKKRKGGPSSEFVEDLNAPAEYSDSDNTVPWVKPLLGDCYDRCSCWCQQCILMDRHKLWRVTRRHNLLMRRTLRLHEQEVEKLKTKIRKLETQNGTLKSLRMMNSINNSHRK